MCGGITWDGRRKGRELENLWPRSWLWLFLCWRLTLGPSHVDHDGFGQTILGAHAVGIPEELKQTKARLKHRCAVAQASLNGLPKTHALAGEGDDAGAGDPSSGRLAVAEIVGQSPVENHRDDVSRFVEIPDETNVCLMENEAAPGEFNGTPEDDGDQQINRVTSQALPEVGKR